MNYSFTVQRKLVTPSGKFVETEINGHKTYMTDFDFKEGDKIEMSAFDGYCPTKITVNGIEKWGEKDRRKWWVAYDPLFQCRDNPYRDQYIKSTIQ